MVANSSLTVRSKSMAKKQMPLDEYRALRIEQYVDGTLIDELNAMAEVFQFLKRDSKSKETFCLADAISDLALILSVVIEQTQHHKPHKESLDRPISSLGLWNKVFYKLKAKGISTVRDLIELSADDLYAIRGIGTSSICQVESRLRELGLSLRAESNGI